MCSSDLAWSYLVISAVLHSPFAQVSLKAPRSEVAGAADEAPTAMCTIMYSPSCLPRVLASHCAEVDENDRCLSYQVSLLELVARPELFDGKRVRVTGYVHLEFEGNALYLSRHDLDHHQYANGVWVEFETGLASKLCQDRYVIIEGRFSSEDRGHLGMWSGAIREISLCQPW